VFELYCIIVKFVIISNWVSNSKYLKYRSKVQILTLYINRTWTFFGYRIRNSLTLAASSACMYFRISYIFLFQNRGINSQTCTHTHTRKHTHTHTHLQSADEASSVYLLTVPASFAFSTDTLSLLRLLWQIL